MALGMPWPPRFFVSQDMLLCWHSTTLLMFPSLYLTPSSAKERCASQCFSIWLQYDCQYTVELQQGTLQGLTCLCHAGIASEHMQLTLTTTCHIHNRRSPLVILLMKCYPGCCVLQVHAHLHIPKTQQGLLMTGGQLPINQHPSLPQNWTALKHSQCAKTEEDVLSKGQELKTSDLDIADMVRHY